MAGRATDTTPARERSPLGVLRVLSLPAAFRAAPKNAPARLNQVSIRSVRMNSTSTPTVQHPQAHRPDIPLDFRAPLCEPAAVPENGTGLRNPEETRQPHPKAWRFFCACAMRSVWPGGRWIQHPQGKAAAPSVSWVSNLPATRQVRIETFLPGVVFTSRNGAFV